MTAQRKRFDRDLFQKYDQLARDVTTKYLQSIGYEVTEHPDRYAQDLIAYSTNKDFCVECEVKLVWEVSEFPYPNVQLPERKKKFFSVPTQFFIWNKPLEHAMTFWSHDVATLEPVEVPNKYVYSGEYFYQVPMEMIQKVKACE
jgi:hypothetical protein